MNELLKDSLDLFKENIQQANLDWVTVIDGDEGAGKTTLAEEVCSYVDPTFNAQRVAYSYQQLMTVIDSIGEESTAKAVLLDEGAETLYKGDYAKKDVKEMMKLFFRIRKKKLFFVICIPSIFDLIKTFSSRRIKTLFHCVFTLDAKGILRQGTFQAFNYDKVKEIMLKAKYPKPTFSGHFNLEDLNKKLWDDIQQRNFEFLNATHNKKMVALEVKHSLDLRILEVCKVLLKGVVSASIPTREIAEEMKKEYGFAPNWLTTQLIGKRLKKLGFEVKAQGGATWVMLDSHFLDKHAEAIKLEIEEASKEG